MLPELLRIQGLCPGASRPFSPRQPPSGLLIRRLCTLALLCSWLLPLAAASEHWTELNIGPFYVATDGDTGAARDAVTQLEQTRWVLGNLLESKDLLSLWPIHILLRNGAKPQAGEFVWQNGRYLLVTSPGTRLPLGNVARLLLDANTPRLPAEVESGLRQLFSTLEAHGSRVTWGGPPSGTPDLAWARMQLFATKFEYGASFHIFLTALKGGSTLAAAERNAFGKAPGELETEAKANLAAGHWTAVPVSGRPLDPKRDFGVHSLDPVLAGVYLADWGLSSDRKQSEAAYKAAVEAGGPAAALGYEGLGTVAKLDGEDPQTLWEDAIRAGSHSAPVYVGAAESLPGLEAMSLLKRAAQLNDRWALPLILQAKLATVPAEKEALLKSALKLDPRATASWVELAQLQTQTGEATAAQGSWLRAEDSAPNDVERDRIHQLRLGSEQERLAAAEDLRRPERDAAHLADQQAQQAESDRIRAAERKANQSLDSAAGSDKPSDVVDWNSLVGQKKLSGSLTRVDCLKNGWRLWVREKSGASKELFLSKQTAADFACGSQFRPRRIALEYRAAPDEDLHTAGEITSFQLQ